MAQQGFIKRPYQKVADQLLVEIKSGKYLPETRLPSERQLAQTFGVGRPVIREAIIALEIIGSVAVKANSGIYVLHPPREADSKVELDASAFELFEARLLVEGEVAFLAAGSISDDALDALDDILERMRIADDKHWIEDAESLDEQFHLIIVESVNNRALRDVVEYLWEGRRRSQLAMRLLSHIHGRGIGRRVEEHTEIARALRARSPAAAKAAMRRHIGCVIAELAAATDHDSVDANDESQNADAGLAHRSIISGIADRSGHQ